jgi:hypothetical protein
MTARTAIIVGLLATTVAAALVFTRLGHYPFWYDEADTVIFARGVWETGDTSAWYGDNLYAYRGGALLDGFRNRGVPPAGYYLSAPFWGFSDGDRFWMRLPYALCGLATIGLALWWAYVRGASLATFSFFACALALNVSLMLYARQCRYYALGMLLTIVIAYLYDHYEGRPWRLVALAAALGLLAATHYLNFATAAAALVVDYAVRGKSRPKLSPREWAILVVPTAVIVAFLAIVFNPVGRHESINEHSQGFLLDKLTLLWRTIRDVNRCEMGVLAIMAAAPLVALLRRDGGLIRLFVACAIYLVVTTLLSPQPVGLDGDADVRYLAPLIVPCVALTVLTLTTAAGSYRVWVAPLIAAIVLSNVLHRPLDREAWRSTLWEYAYELRFPRRTATETTAQWLTANVAKDAWVTVIPTDWLAPLIVAAPHVRYGWQFDAKQQTGPYADLRDPMFVGVAPVEALVVSGLGDTAEQVERDLLPPIWAERGWKYERVAVLDSYFDDRTRPELIWHWFRDRSYDKSKRGIYVYRLVQ